MAGDLLINAKRPPRIHVKEREFSKEGKQPKNQLLKFGMSKIQIITKSMFLIK